MNSYLEQACTRFGCNTLNYLHIVKEDLTSSVDFSRVSAILPSRADNDVNKAVSPNRVNSCRVRIYTGCVSTSTEARGRFSGSIRALRENSLVAKSRCLKEFFSKLFRLFGFNDLFG